MNKRLLTAAVAIALSALAAPAHARPHWLDDAEDSRSYRQRTYDRYDRDDDDDERSHRRRQRQRQHASREKSGAQQERKATGQETAQPQRLAALPPQPQESAKPALPLLALLPQAARPAPRQHARNDGRGCLKPTALALLDRIEAQFGPMQLISTCRPGARIAGSGRISKHATGEAIDFNAGRRKSEVVRWLIANHKSGGTMTYAGMSHIHVDVGPHFVALNSGGG